MSTNRSHGPQVHPAASRLPPEHEISMGSEAGDNVICMNHVGDIEGIGARSVKVVGGRRRRRHALLRIPW